MSKKQSSPASSKERPTRLTEQRNLKMARSAHAYVRGNTQKFYDWLEKAPTHLPKGPAVWICGDCHVGNLGPVANAKGHIEIQIRDLDQTVIGNPAHDLIRLGLSLSTAARGSDLPGVVTARMMEAMMEGYEQAFIDDKKALPQEEMPEAVGVMMKRALKRSWKHLARERIEDTKPTIPLGKRFWPLLKPEKQEIVRLFAQEDVRKLVTSLRSRDDDAQIEVLDAAYWMKGCSSLGLLRYAVLIEVNGGHETKRERCLIDVKEAAQAVAPRYTKAKIPRDNGQRVVEGAQHLSPYLGNRMLAARFNDRAVFLRELMPQDLKLEIEHLTADEATKVARYLAHVVGKAHARQMDPEARDKWQKQLASSHTKTLEAPSWLWSSVVELIMSHESGYLEHCRRYALQARAREV